MSPLATPIQVLLTPGAMKAHYAPTILIVGGVLAGCPGSSTHDRSTTEDPNQTLSGDDGGISPGSEEPSNGDPLAAETDEEDSSSTLDPAANEPTDTSSEANTSQGSTTEEPTTVLLQDTQPEETETVEVEEQAPDLCVSLPKHWAFEYSTPKDLEEFYFQTPIIVLGTLVGIEEGRSQTIGTGCPPNPSGQIPITCDDAPSIAPYITHANFVIEPLQLMKGSLPDPAAQVYLEQAWPTNVNVESLAEVAPIGSRVMIAGDLAESHPALDDGDLPANLLDAGPFGFAFEGEEAAACFPWLEDEDIEWIDALATPAAFEEVIAAAEE